VLLTLKDEELAKAFLHFTVHNSHSSNLNSLPSASSLAYNPSGKILICPKYENLLLNTIEENKAITATARANRQLSKMIEFGAIRRSSAKFDGHRNDAVSMLLILK
jgi:hypothetical protein